MDVMDLKDVHAEAAQESKIVVELGSKGFVGTESGRGWEHPDLGRKQVLFRPVAKGVAKDRLTHPATVMGRGVQVIDAELQGTVNGRHTLRKRVLVQSDPTEADDCDLLAGLAVRTFL
jgi:hypothetical protein